MKKWGRKPIICLQGVKNLQNLAKKTEKKTGCWLIENKDKRLLEALIQRLEYDIYIWGHEKHRCMSRAMKGIAAFNTTSYLLLHLLTPLLRRPCFDFGFLGLKVSPLMEQSPGVERLLSASPNDSYKRCWSTSGGVWLPIKAPRCFLLLGSFSIKQGNRGMAFGCYHFSIDRTPYC